MQTSRLLEAVAEAGAPRELISALMEMIDENADQEQIDYLAGPIVLHESAWMDTVPKDLLRAVSAERLRTVQAERAGQAKWRVGPIELACVMMPAMFEAARPTDLSDLYLWATAHAMAEVRGRPIEQTWADLEGDPVSDEVVLNPRGRCYHAHRDLTHEIRRKVIRLAKERRRGTKWPRQKADKSSRRTPEVTTEQISLFN